MELLKWWITVVKCTESWSY